MFKKRKFLSILLSLIMVTTCFGNQQKDSKEDNSELRERISKMEKDLEALRKAALQEDTTVQSESKVKEQKQVQTGAPWKLTSKAAGQKEAPSTSNLKLEKENPIVEKKAPVYEIQEPKTISGWSNLDIQLYGYIKLDAAYDTDRSSAGNYMRWVESDLDNKGHDNQFNMTANQTRLGAKISGPENNGLKTSGLVEVDFYGNGTAENKAGLMMRHAYMTLDWVDEHFTILAGQTSDVISPLVPTVLNYSVDWWVGNIGYRRPQIRLTKSTALSDDSDLKIEAAAVRTIGGGDSTAWTDDGGEDAGQPGVQARVSLNLPLGGCKPSTLGFSSHWAKEEYDTNASGTSRRKYDSWSFNVDLVQPVSKTLNITGEFFTGENLSAYLGGIGQGVNLTTHQEIASNGGWLAASIGPCDKWAFNLGASMEDVKAGDVDAGNRTVNSSVFGNAIYTVNKSSTIGFELSQWHTERKGEGSSDCLRGQLSFIYKF
jgi:hypothetical protein